MELKVINSSLKTISSLEVSEMIDKPHNDLMKSIRQYCEYLIKGNFSLNEFFLESTYQDGINRTLPCYLLTKKGCELVANKMTGEKGTLFTAVYIEKFNEMEEQIKLPRTYKEALIALVQAEEEKEKMLFQLTYKDDVIITLTKDVTLATKQQRINDIVRHTNNFKKIQERWLLLYSEFDKAMHIDTKRRYENALASNETKANNRLTFICNTLNLTDELYRVCVKLFEADARQMFNNILDLI